ncbi:MAG: PDZ domain-containing protein [Actinobacteria bacterium]|nr:PDZ domain-containing protein [Actinomycetota bacterium]MCB9390564.1 PDZ domain-containing protein [Acidimicrobiia bacterium]
MVAKNTPGDGLPDPTERLWVHPAELPALPGARRVPPPPRRSVLATLRHGLRHPLFAGVVGAGMVLAGAWMLGLSSSRQTTIAPVAGVFSGSTQSGITAAPTTLRDQPDHNALNQARASVIQLLTSDGDTHAVATALVLDEDHLMTADLGLTDRGEIVAAVRHGNLVLAQVAQTDSSTGITILQVDEHIPTSLTRVDKLTRERPEPAQDCRIVSASPNLHGTDMVGSCTVQSEENNDPDLAGAGLFYLQGQFQASDRGALILDEHNNALGVVVQTLPDDAGHAIALRIDDAIAVASSVPETPQRPGIAGLQVADLTARISIEGNLGGGALVVSVAADSAAAHAGLVANDVLVELNGQPVAGAAQFRQLASRVRPGELTRLTVWRSGSTVELTVMP